MYEHSRDLFRLLKPELMPDAGHPGRPGRMLLAACEGSVERMAMDARFRPYAARQLFRHTRVLFPLHRQLPVFRLIERGVSKVADTLDAERASDGRQNLLRCAAVNRKGKPCGREPMRGGRYCPSHRHLENRDSDRAGVLGAAA
jgi:hypothetical protein